MHEYIHKIVFLSATGDFYILVSILHCKNDDFSIIFINSMVKSQKNLAFGSLHICKKNWPSTNYIFVEKIAFDQIHIFWDYTPI